MYKYILIDLCSFSWNAYQNFEITEFKGFGTTSSGRWFQWIKVNAAINGKISNTKESDTHFFRKCKRPLREDLFDDIFKASLCHPDENVSDGNDFFWIGLEVWPEGENWLV